MPVSSSGHRLAVSKFVVMQKIPRRLPSIASLATIIAAGAFIAACAAPSSSNGDLRPERLAQLQHICADTMQLDPGNVHFEDCMVVLGDVARKLDRGREQP
jgi:hypothetical protein